MCGIAGCGDPAPGHVAFQEWSTRPEPETETMIAPPEWGDAMGRVWVRRRIPHTNRHRTVLACRVGDVIPVGLAQSWDLVNGGDHWPPLEAPGGPEIETGPDHPIETQEPDLEQPERSWRPWKRKGARRAS